MRKSCLLKCWSLSLHISSAVQVHTVECKVDVSFVATGKKEKHIYRKIRITTFNTAIGLVRLNRVHSFLP